MSILYLKSCALIVFYLLSAFVFLLVNYLIIHFILKKFRQQDEKFMKGSK